MEGDGCTIAQTVFRLSDGVLHSVERLESHVAGDIKVGGAGQEHAGEVSGGGASGVPHEEGVGAVVAVAIAVLVDELGAVGEVVGEEVPELVGVQGHGKEPLVELSIRGVVDVIELVLAGVGEDDDATRSDQGPVLKHAVGVFKSLVSDQRGLMKELCA